MIVGNYFVKEDEAMTVAFGTQGKQKVGQGNECSRFRLPRLFQADY